MTERTQNLIAGRPNFGEAIAPKLKGAWLQAARAAWIVLAMAAGGILIAAIPGYAAKFGGQLAHVTGSELPPGAHFFAAASGVASLVSALISIGLSALLFRRKFTEPMAAFLSLFLLGYGTAMSGPLEFASEHWLGSVDYATGAQGVLLATPMVLLFLLFPNGRFVPAWTRWVVPVSVLWNFALFLLVPFDAASITRWPVLTGIIAVTFITFIGIGLYAQVFRYRKTASRTERHQIQWAIYGFALSSAYILISSAPYFYLIGLPSETPTPWWGPASELGWWLSLNIIPVCLTIAITRYHLWDIEVVVNRTLVYGALTASVLALYALVVGGMGLIFQTDESRFLPLLATGLAAILFHPLRLRIQRGIDRMMYGERDEPFEVLSRLGQRLENTLSPEMVYPTIVETVSQALKLPYVAIAVRRSQGFETVESYGKPVDDPVTYPLTYQGEFMGELRVAQRVGDEAFSPEDERILRNIARQTGAAVHAVQLMADLQRSRQQLVTAREEERRRLRRDLHDGLGATLAALHLEAGAVRRSIRSDPDKAEALLDEFKAEIKGTIDEIRRLVYALRPPTLDQLGLVAAIQAQAAKWSRPDRRSGRDAPDQRLQIKIEAPDKLPPLPAAAEVAAFRIVQEALANVVHHSQAQNCVVRLGLEDECIQIEIVDDGVGVRAPSTGEPSPGLGLLTMRERAVELGGACEIEPAPGGGTRVRAVIPLPEE